MIHVWFGAPRQGKTYSVTRLAILRMMKGRRVYSNYPIITRGKQIFSSMVWQGDMIYENIHNCDIVIDEAYRDYSSRKYQNFSIDQHTFFATNGHNDIDIHLITQNPARIDLIIREIVNFYHWVNKVELPWGRPLYFRDYVYLLEADMISRSKERTFMINRYLFRKIYAEAYDTLYYRKQGEKPYEPTPWLEAIEKEIANG